MKRTSTVNQEAAEAQIQVGRLEEKVKSLEHIVEDKTREVSQLKINLAEKDKTAKTDSERSAQTIKSLQSDLDAAHKKMTEKEATQKESAARLAAAEKELKTKEEATNRLQSELNSVQEQRAKLAEDNKKLEAEIKAAIGELTRAKETLVEESEARRKAEETKVLVEKSLEDLMEEIQRREERREEELQRERVQDGWGSASELVLTGAIAAVGAATVVSMFFMRYYSTTQ